ncbi:aldo/keto reductase [Amycolatopsis sp. GM8]|uniref:aldo/keto reductase n=1 Tax=Amycolatopsis sp. GM8 TaxID=2896530 RepID=UPI001F33726D|nr:aldo/keto reductase [Amycolatopsis sp. GM8]
MGCAQLGADVTGSDAITLVRAALAEGLTFFDTADVYAGGESERLLGRALRGRHDECVVATKYRHGACPGAGRKSVRVAVDGSLRRLGVDYIDLFQLHAPDPATPLAETVGALQDLVGQGKILYFGLGNTTAADALAAAELASPRVPVTSVQAPMSLLDIARLDALGQLANRTGIGLLAAAPLARGLLAGSYDLGRRPPPGHALLSRKGFGYWTDRGRAVAERVRQVAATHGTTPVRVALSAVLDHPGVSAVVVGCRSREQLSGCADVRPGLLDPLTIEQLRGVLTTDTISSKEPIT